MRLALPFVSVALLAHAGAPRTTPASAPRPATAPVPAKAPPPLDEPEGTAAARISGPPAALTAACKDAMSRARAGLEVVKASKPPRDTVATLTAYDDALAALNDLDAQSELARQASPDPAMRAAAEDCDRQIQSLVTAINQDRALYDVLSGTRPVWSGRFHGVVDEARPARVPAQRRGP